MKKKAIALKMGVGLSHEILERNLKLMMFCN